MKLLAFLVSILIFSVSHSQNLEQTIQAGKADKIKTLIHISGGTLNMSQGSSELADVDLSYDRNEWSPSVSYTEDGSLGKLIVKASIPGDEKRIDDDNVCNIKLSKKFEYALGIVLGAGVANLDFEGYKIRKALFKLGVGSFDINLANTSLPLLKIDAGIGEATVDLTGDYKNDLKAEINAGIGELKIYVPEDTGVQFEVHGFLGDVNAQGFRKNGKTYVNSKYGKSKHAITMRINGAIGSIKIIER